MSGVYPEGVEVRRFAQISDDGLYRYSLGREWGRGGPVVTFVMLNPSTADAELDDPTIRRCVGFTRSLGYSGMRVVNLYAFRATKPTDLWKAADPVGPRNDDYLTTAGQRVQREGGMLVAAWGVNARPDRVAAVQDLPGWGNLHALGVSKDGSPRHPLYLPGDSQPVPWGRAAEAAARWTF